jgi:class II lanthipeptide synthase
MDPVTPVALARIVAEASPIRERLASESFEPDPENLRQDEPRIRARLDRWCQVVARGDWELFRRRLEWSGWDVDRVHAALGTVRLREGRELPAWAGTLAQVMQTTAEFFGESAGPLGPLPVDSGDPLPFEDLLLPAVIAARRKLLAHLHSPDLPSDLLSQDAYLALERSLLRKLTTSCGQVLAAEFSRLHPGARTVLQMGDDCAPPRTSQQHYKTFVTELLRGGLAAVFRTYPVLGRLVATTIDFWVESTEEFLRRLELDWPAIRRVFESSQRPAPDVRPTHSPIVVSVRSSLSDPHNRGRQVIALTLSSGQKVIYKPRDVSLEAAYYELVAWCNERAGLPLSLRVVRVLTCSGYGWMECVEQSPCEDDAAAHRYYQRAGMLLCLLHVLGTNDCHFENLVASGEEPILVDAETLLHHQPGLTLDPSEAAVDRQFRESVLQTGLLPQWQMGRDGRGAYDLSGLGAIGPQQLPIRHVQWKAVNSDGMHFTYEAVSMLGANVPTLRGVDVHPNDFSEELTQGFEQMYRFLIEQRAALLAPNGPLAAFRMQRVRILFRPTVVYGLLLRKAAMPGYLRDGADLSIEVEFLNRTFLTTPERPDTWAIAETECRAIEQLDIPYFTASTGSAVLMAGSESIDHYFSEPSFGQTMSRLLRLGEGDLRWQTGIIRGTLAARVAQPPHAGGASAVIPMRGGPHEGESRVLPAAELLQEAQRIAAEIKARAVEAPDGRVTWISLQYIPGAERFQFQPLGEDLYSGHCGIALFLAALYRVDGNTEHRDLALAALRNLRRVLNTADADEKRQRFARDVGIGGATGLGSIVYALVSVGRLLRDAELLEDARRAAHLVTRELIARDRQLHVMGGAAGAILGLLALANAIGEKAVIARAVACGQRLLIEQRNNGRSPRAWKTAAEKFLTGFAHGAAGIAYALLRLFAVTRDRAYIEAAEEGMAYERSVFSSEAANWPDLRFHREGAAPEFSAGWCHGAPGIGLARLGGAAIVENEAYVEDVAVAVETIKTCDRWDVDHLCCGHLGRIDVLLTAGQKLSRPELSQLAQERAAWVVMRARRLGAYRLFGNLPPRVFCPGLFQGIAGIGYELLRLATAEALPSVLLWE